MKTMLKGLLIGAALLVLSARPAQAQDLSGGYALVNWNGCCAHGVMVDFSHPLHNMGSTGISVVADLGWTRFSGEESDTTVVGGARFHFLNNMRVPLFGQVTAGVVHWSEDAFEGFAGASGNDFILGFGGGTIIKVTKMIGFKPQVDFFILPGNNSDWFFRFTANAVINLKK